jgi:hypothetical protein
MNSAPCIRPLLYTLLVYLAALTLLALVATDSAFLFLFREDGLFEQASLVFWLLLAILLLFCIRPFWTVALPAVFLSLLAAAREADWNRRFTGYSVLKVGYFLNPAFSTAGKLLTAAVLLATLAASLALVADWRRRRDRLSASGRRALQIAAVAVAALAVSKMIDRAPALLAELTGTQLPQFISHTMMAWEEGIECIVPAILAIAVITAARSAAAARSLNPTAANEESPAASAELPADLHLRT